MNRGDGVRGRGLGGRSVTQPRGAGSRLGGLALSKDKVSHLSQRAVPTDDAPQGSIMRRRGRRGALTDTDRDAL